MLKKLETVFQLQKKKTRYHGMSRWVGKPQAANGIVRYTKFMMFFNTFVREFVFPYNSQWVVEKKLKGKNSSR